MFMDSEAFSDGEDVFSGLNRRGTFMIKRRAIRRSSVCMASLVRLRGGMAGGILVKAMSNSTDAFEKIKQFLSVSAGRQGGGHEIRERTTRVTSLSRCRRRKEVSRYHPRRAWRPRRESDDSSDPHSKEHRPTREAHQSVSGIPGVAPCARA